MDISNKSVLIVEDDVKINKMLKFLFMSKGCEVDIAVNGADALRVIENLIPDIILLDLKMPEMDGFEFLKIIKSDARYKEIPVIILSALPSNKNEEMLKSIGACNYIQKPFAAAEVVKSVASVM